MSIEYFLKDEIIAQVGPTPSSDVVLPGVQTEYSRDSYNVNDINIPWGWIIFVFLFLGMLIALFFVLKKKLEKKDRDEKAKKWTLYEVRVPRVNEITISFTSLHISSSGPLYTY